MDIFQFTFLRILQFFTINTQSPKKKLKQKVKENIAFFHRRTREHTTDKRTNPTEAREELEKK